MEYVTKQIKRRIPVQVVSNKRLTWLLPDHPWDTQVGHVVYESNGKNHCCSILLHHFGLLLWLLPSRLFLIFFVYLLKLKRFYVNKNLCDLQWKLLHPQQFSVAYAYVGQIRCTKYPLIFQLTSTACWALTYGHMLHMTHKLRSIEEH